jgi:hypothetical protein
MAGRGSLNAKTLEALGPARLADLLLLAHRGHCGGAAGLAVGVGGSAGAAGDGVGGVQAAGHGGAFQQLVGS